MIAWIRKIGQSISRVTTVVDFLVCADGNLVTGSCNLKSYWAQNQL